MKALAMPISSRTAEDTPSACFCTNSPRILEERCATSWHTSASACASVLSACCIIKTTMETERAEFSISELAREFDITPRAIRFYEDQGLLAPRRDGQRRIYSPRD